MKIDRHQAETGGPRVKSKRGAWTYSDPAVQERALRLDLEHGINLAELDDWIEAESWPDAEQLQRVLGWRERIVRASNDDAAEGWAMFMMTLAAFNMREQKLHPLAVLGQWVKPRLDGKAPGDRVTLRIPKLRAGQRKVRDKAIAALSAAGRTDAEIARTVNLTPRHVRRILNP